MLRELTIATGNPTMNAIDVLGRQYYSYDIDKCHELAKEYA